MSPSPYLSAAESRALAAKARVLYPDAVGLGPRVVSMPMAAAVNISRVSVTTPAMLRVNFIEDSGLAAPSIVLGGAVSWWWEAWPIDFPTPGAGFGDFVPWRGSGPLLYLPHPGDWFVRIRAVNLVGAQYRAWVSIFEGLSTSDLATWFQGPIATRMVSGSLVIGAAATVNLEFSADNYGCWFGGLTARFVNVGANAIVIASGETAAAAAVGQPVNAGASINRTFPELWGRGTTVFSTAGSTLYYEVSLP